MEDYHVAIIKQTKKSSGITYVYESTSYWDKEKQQPRSTRKLIGKVDDATGEIVPTGGRGRKPKKQDACPIESVSCNEDYKALYEAAIAELQEKEKKLLSLNESITLLSKRNKALVNGMKDLIDSNSI